MNAPVRNEIPLPGCNPTPLASYLKALGVLRLVAEQGGDPDVRGCWRDDVFVLQTKLSAEGVERFLLESYSPTPLVAPWNAGSGFYLREGKSKESDPDTGRRIKTGVRDQPTQATRTLAAIEASTADRFLPFRAAVAAARRCIHTMNLRQAPNSGEQKNQLVRIFRNQSADELIPWIDSTVVLSDDAARYPPLLGSGGNDGNLDFSNNHMQRLVDLFDLKTGNARPCAGDLLRSGLSLQPTDGMADTAIGQFAPGYAGGPNASAGFDGSAKVNPWDFVLMLEGAVVLAASAARRLNASGSAAMSAPFTVRSRSGTVGAASQADDADARGEIWLPLWTNWWSIDEVAALFAEGRAVMGTRPVRDGLDFARAIAALGVDRGLRSFQRYGFLMRSGKAFLATPLGRVAVRRNTQADLIDELERRDWLARVQRHAREDTAPSAFRSLAGQLDAALFALTQREGREAVQRVLRLTGRVQALCITSIKSREALPPMPDLSESWVVQADDGSAEFAIAHALAGLSFPVPQAKGPAVALGLRPHVAPVTMDGREWHPESRLVCWGLGPLDRNLAALLHRRTLVAAASGQGGEVLSSQTGASLGDVLAFIEGRTDDRRIAELAAGLACVPRLPRRAPTTAGELPAVPPAYAWLKPLFASEAALKRSGWLAEDRSLHLPAEVPARLRANDVSMALRLAWQRLQALDKRLPGRTPPASFGLNGTRLLAALIIPLTARDQRALMHKLGPLDSSDQPATASTESTTH